MGIKLSKTSKLDGISSWSLQAVDTCPGARRDDRELVEVCQGCYATKGWYQCTSVKRVREDNKQNWKDPLWVEDMVAALGEFHYFRWFDSGDLYCVDLAVKIYWVMLHTPATKHWLPTRSYKFDKFHTILKNMAALPNVCVRFSADELDKRLESPQNNSMVFTNRPPKGIFECTAYKNNPAQCNGCRACWDKSIKTIGYRAHGRDMAQIIKWKELNGAN